ncbi:hypothetical protein DPMN_142518 [Dreissena polymorpha]|uniref:Uncharacterized protein n=1 Tax=Dreissena polymorpha TaxID=45954 RepID=A0A9D4JJ87_DREPO|nr:hypothetical protein DPMN_142518 [Dreissena polymorpha]
MATNTYLKEGAVTVTELKSSNRKFPVIVRTFASDYEVPNEEDLPDDDDILLDKLEHLDIARVRVLPIIDEDAIRKTKGVVLLKVRKKLEGQEFWISAEYGGKVKILNRSPRPRRYISITQVLENRPRFVKIGGDMQSCIKGLSPGSGKLVLDNTILELQGVIQSEYTAYRYLKGKVGDCVFYFRDDQVANMVEVDDPGCYSLLDLKKKSISLPQHIMFETMPPSDIVLKDDEKKREAYALFHGPLELLLFIRTSQTIAWKKIGLNDNASNYLAMIPKSFCDTLEVSINEIAREKDRNEYLDANFTDYQENEWIRPNLFVIPTKHDKQWTLTWLKRPSDYLSVSDGDIMMDPYPASPPYTSDYRRSPVTPKAEQSPVLNVSQIPKPDGQPSTSQKESGWVEKCTEKARLGFDKIHKEMKKRMTLVFRNRSNTDQNTDTDVDSSGKSISQKSSTTPSTGNVPNSPQRRHFLPLPRPLPLTPTEQAKTTHTRFEVVEDSKPQYGFIHTAGNWQLKENFYSFTAFEVHECMKQCFPDNPKVAEMCLQEKLDGHFFRDCCLGKFCQAVGLGGLQEIKLTQIVQQGWRPKF